MNTLRCRVPVSLLVLALSASIVDVDAQPAPPPAAPVSSASSAAPATQVDSASEDRNENPWEDEDRSERHGGGRRHGDDLVNFGSDSLLPKDQHADSVVSILGSTSVQGEAREAVSILGNTRVEGALSRDAVAVFGNAYVDNTVGGDVVAVLGNVELGPNAVVGHDVVAVGGKVKRDPAASVGGSVKSVGGNFPVFDWLHPWIQHCLFYARPLAIAPGLGWAWGLALTFLALYLCIALLFRDAVDRCMQTLEARPGPAVLAALLTVLLVPVLIVLLCITLVGVAAIPFIVIGLFCAGLFGKAVMLAWIGRRALGARRDGPMGHTASAVLIGGIIVLVLYLIPVLGFVLYKLLGLIGLGAVVYTLIGAARERRDTIYAPGPVQAVASAGGARASATEAPVAAAPLAPGAAATAAAQPAGPVPGTPGPAPAGAAFPGAPASGAPAAAVVTASLPRAGFWVRMVALLLDTILIGVLMSTLHHLFHLELMVLAAYGAILWKMRGATIGGVVFDLRVVRLDGRPVDWETAIVRALGCFLSMAVAGLGFIWIAFDHQKQAWHDKIAGTVVVRVAKGVPLV